VRSTAVLVHDRLDPPEVGLELHAAVLVDGDVRGVAAVGRREQRIVAGDDPELDGKSHWQPAALD
jgi:hypothetical protein